MGNPITRRRLGLAALGALAARPGLAAFRPPGPGRVDCRVMRHGSDIGRATFSFAAQAAELQASIAIDIRLKVGFITVFRYTHANTEHWRDDQLLGFDARTDDNGTAHFAQARWNGTALDVTGSRTAPYAAPPRALGTTYWNPRTVVDPLISSQNGRLLDIRMTDLGPSRAILAGGQAVPANEYRMTGEMRMNLWYDQAQIWSGLDYYAHDGSIVTYEKIV